jgi:beta-glucosidase
LAPGQKRTVDFDVDPLYLSVFNTDANRWEIVPGEYQVLAGGSPRELPLKAAVSLEGTRSDRSF